MRSVTHTEYLDVQKPLYLVVHQQMQNSESFIFKCQVVYIWKFQKSLKCERAKKKPQGVLSHKQRHLNYELQIERINFLSANFDTTPQEHWKAEMLPSFQISFLFA